jgi:hypothetical protein
MTERYGHVVDMARKNPALFIPVKRGEGRVGTHLRPAGHSRDQIVIGISRAGICAPWSTLAQQERGQESSAPVVDMAKKNPALFLPVKVTGSRRRSPELTLGQFCPILNL